MEPQASLLGVDLIEIKKAKSFYESHKDNLASFFSRREIAEIHKDKKSHEKLAVLLAAKESVFKALGPRPAGLLGFSNISVSKRNLKKLGLELSVVKRHGLIVVECHSNRPRKVISR